MFWLENALQSLCMVGIMVSSYKVIYWWKKDKPVRLMLNLLLFLYTFTMYDSLESLYVG